MVGLPVSGSTTPEKTTKEGRREINDDKSSAGGEVVMVVPVRWPTVGQILADGEPKGGDAKSEICYKNIGEIF